MSKFKSIGDTACYLGVSTQTLRRWEKEGKLKATERTAGGQRRYDLSKICPHRLVPNVFAEKITIAYARVSSYDQKDDLERQKQKLGQVLIITKRV